MDEIYYNEPKFKIGNGVYYMYMCEGQRGRGKTARWLNILASHALETSKKFIYLRRSDKEMELALEKGIFNCCFNVPEYKALWEKYPKQAYKNGNIYLIDCEDKYVHVGYYLTLNNVKGISIEDADTCLFDEYVAQRRSQYKGGEYGLHEPTLLFRLLETIFRLKNFYLIMLGNKDTPSNPYNETYRIPFNTKLYKDKSVGLWYEYDYSQATADLKATTTLGIISKNTSYNDYSMGLKSLDEVDESLIATKPSHATQQYNVKILGKLLTIWLDRKNAIMYLTSAYKLNPSCATICVTNSDMSINTDFIRYDGMFLDVLKSFYGSGKMRFDNQETASLLATMLALK